MWIEISKKISDISNMNGSCALAITNLFNMMMKNHHIVYFPGKMLESIINDNNNKFGDLIKKFAIHIYRNHSTIYSWKNEISCKIIVDDVEKTTKKNNIFYVPISFFEDAKYTRLITEHESDFEVFESIYRYVKKKEKKDSYYDIDFKNDSGHGANISSKINDIASKDEIGLVYLDSDQDYDGGPKGETYNLAYKEIKKHPSNVLELDVLSVREKENLFNPKMYVPFCDSTIIDFLEKLEGYQSKDVYYYFDIKEGIKYSKFNDNDWVSHYSSFIKDGIFSIPKNPSADSLCSCSIGDKVCNKMCNCLLTLDDETFKKIISVIRKDRGKHIASDILDRRKKIDSYLPDSLYEEWKNIYDKLSVWGIRLADQYSYRFKN